MRIRIDRAVLDVFPGVWITGVLMDGIDNTSPAGVLPDRRIPRPVADLENRLEVWRVAYRKLGINPKRCRPSAEALLRQLDRKGVLPNINPIVDLYNDVSVRHLVPVGGYDVDALQGDVDLVRAEGGEPFSPLPAGSPEEHAEPGEVIYRDRIRVLTRRWNFRDTAATAIGPETSRVLLCAELPDDSIDPSVLAAVAGDLTAGLEQLGGRQVAVFHLSSASPEFSSPGG